MPVSDVPPKESPGNRRHASNNRAVGQKNIVVNHGHVNYLQIRAEKYLVNPCQEANDEY